MKRARTDSAENEEMIGEEEPTTENHPSVKKPRSSPPPPPPSSPSLPSMPDTIVELPCEIWKAVLDFATCDYRDKCAMLSLILTCTTFRDIVYKVQDGIIAQHTSESKEPEWLEYRRGHPSIIAFATRERTLAITGKGTRFYNGDVNLLIAGVDLFPGVLEPAELRFVLHDAVDPVADRRSRVECGCQGAGGCPRWRNHVTGLVLEHAELESLSVSTRMAPSDMRPVPDGERATCQLTLGPNRLMGHRAGSYGRVESYRCMTQASVPMPSREYPGKWDRLTVSRSRLNIPRTLRDDNDIETVARIRKATSDEAVDPPHGEVEEVRMEPSPLFFDPYEECHTFLRPGKAMGKVARSGFVPSTEQAIAFSITYAEGRIDWFTMCTKNAARIADAHQQTFELVLLTLTGLLETEILARVPYNEEGNIEDYLGDDPRRDSFIRFVVENKDHGVDPNESIHLWRARRTLGLGLDSEFQTRRPLSRREMDILHL